MTKKILEITSATEPSQLQKILKLLADKKSWSFEFEMASEFSPKKIQGFSAVLIDPELSDKVLPQLSVHSTQCKNMKVLDSINFEAEAFYPRIASYKALQDLIIQKASSWDNRSAVFVVGDGEFSKVAASAVATQGAQKVYLIGDAKKLKDHAEVLRRYQLGVKFEIIPADELTSLELSGSLLINTENLKVKPDLFTALSYFNFLNPNSFVIDAVIDQVQSSDFLIEAQKAGFNAVSNQAFYAFWVSEWCHQFFGTDSKTSIQEIQKVIEEFSP